MYLVTGAAGFIGSHLVKGLNDRGITDIAAVDDLSDGPKFSNLDGCRIADYLDRGELRDSILADSLSFKPSVIFHQGACTDTMEQDGRYMMDNNFTFSKILMEYALTGKIPFIYASSAAVYGRSQSNAIDPANERPLNIYGYSKLVFDQYVRFRLGAADSTVVGLRYFNVYGANETHKGRMASMVYQLYRQLKETGEARLFEGTDGYGDGEQRRDFVFVNDLVKINLHFADNPGFKGIVNAGTGEARTFNDVANIISRQLGRGKITYVPFNPALEGKYQSFTEADLTELRQAGYREPITSLEDGIAQVVSTWDGSA
jgi:ADP-L-glycero-D-manno-heptose 6-epimerase